MVALHVPRETGFRAAFVRMGCAAGQTEADQARREEGSHGDDDGYSDDLDPGTLTASR
jgi:hypothetical protein